MKRSLAEAHQELYLCHYCMKCSTDWDEIIDHMVKDHTDEECTDATGWDVDEFEGVDWMTLSIREMEKIDEMLYILKGLPPLDSHDATHLAGRIVGMKELSRRLGYEPFTVHGGEDWLKRRP